MVPWPYALEQNIVATGVCSKGVHVLLLADRKQSNLTGTMGQV
jgi:hypothetical protein